jgi:hypothetical protein
VPADSSSIKLPLVGDVVPLAKGRDASERKHAGGIRGKTVLQLDDAYDDSLRPAHAPPPQEFWRTAAAA